MFEENRNEKASVYDFRANRSALRRRTLSAVSALRDDLYISSERAPRYDDEETEYFTNQKTLLLKILLNRTPNSKIIGERKELFLLWSLHGKRLERERANEKESITRKKQKWN